MAQWLAYEAAVVVLAAVAYAAGLGYESALGGVAIASGAYLLRFLGAFVALLVRIAWYPERDPHWQARTRAGGPQNPLNVELWRMGGPDYVYGHRCTVRHPSGAIAVATDERPQQVQDKHRRTFYFFYGGLSSHFPSGTPEPVSAA